MIHTDRRGIAEVVESVHYARFDILLVIEPVQLSVRQGPFRAIVEIFLVWIDLLSWLGAAALRVSRLDGNRLLLMIVVSVKFLKILFRITESQWILIANLVLEVILLQLIFVIQGIRDTSDFD